MELVSLRWPWSSLQITSNPSPSLVRWKWCNDWEGFYSWHRGVLESDEVKKRLGGWIDGYWGVGLEGELGMKVRVCEWRSDELRKYTFRLLASCQRNDFVANFDAVSKTVNLISDATCFSRGRE